MMTLNPFVLSLSKDQPELVEGYMRRSAQRTASTSLSLNGVGQ